MTPRRIPCARARRWSAPRGTCTRCLEAKRTHPPEWETRARPGREVGASSLPRPWRGARRFCGTACAASGRISLCRTGRRVGHGAAGGDGPLRDRDRVPALRGRRREETRLKARATREDAGDADAVLPRREERVGRAGAKIGDSRSRTSPRCCVTSCSCARSAAREAQHEFLR